MSPRDPAPQDRKSLGIALVILLIVGVMGVTLIPSEGFDRVVDLALLALTVIVAILFFRAGE